MTSSFVSGRWPLLGVAWIGLAVAACSAPDPGVQAVELGLRARHPRFFHHKPAVMQPPPDSTPTTTPPTPTPPTDEPVPTPEPKPEPTPPAPIRVLMGALEVDVANGDCGVQSIAVPVPSVDLETVAIPAGGARRVLTPGIDVEIPDQPARRAQAPVLDFELPGSCAPGMAERGRTPVVDVTIPDGANQIPMRVQVAVAEIDVPEGSTAAPIRMAIPAIEQDVTGCDGSVRRISTPAIEMGLVTSQEDNQQIPTRVLVSVPDQSADSAQRATVPVSPQDGGAGGGGGAGGAGGAGGKGGDP